MGPRRRCRGCGRCQTRSCVRGRHSGFTTLKGVGAREHSCASSTIEVAMNDLRSAVRSLRATPLVTSVAVLSLTLGIGASTVIFSLTNSLLLRKLPVRDPSALVLVTDPTVPGVRAYAFGVWESFRRFVDVFDGILAWSSTEFNLVPRGEVQIVSGAWVSGSYFKTLGISALLGRVLSESDDQRNG